MAEDYKKVEEKGPNPWLPLFGFVIIVVFGGFSWVIAPLLLPFAARFVQFPSEWPVWMHNGVVAFLVFVVLFAVAMLLIAIFAGGAPRDPYDVRTSAKEIRKQLDERQRRR